MQPLVSIIITNYNYGRFLGEAIESALAQTWQDREILFIDDGSTDDSLDIASRYPITL
ncbi:MAG: glycosyltransferase, partial [Thauera sp.]|nr:glycosyltransferase [Thauera sp.]